MSKMPAQRPWESEQVVETPGDLLAAIESRWGAIDVDLACSRHVQLNAFSVDNRKAPEAIVFPDENALEVSWSARYGSKRCFVNPPFRLCGEFADKCLRESSLFGIGRIFLLTPASVGSNWYRDFVHRKASVFVLNPRLTFVGHTDPYPKDMMLTMFASGDCPINALDVWEWETDSMRERRRRSRVLDIDSLP